MLRYKNINVLCAFILPLFLLAGCESSDSGGTENEDDQPISEVDTPDNGDAPNDDVPTDNEVDTPDNGDAPNDDEPTDNEVDTPDNDGAPDDSDNGWQDEFGIPDDAAFLPEGTPCEEFSHVDHLPWDERPTACPTGDWCMKKDEGLIEDAETWYGLRVVNQYATITCKIGNKCFRFVGMNNCHYDLYDPDLNATLMPDDTIPWARKDGHSYLNFRVRLPGESTIYNFMSTTAEAVNDAKEAVYCPANVYAPDGVEPLRFDPRQADQTIGCGAESPIIGLYGDVREPIPYDTDTRDAYDWTYKQDGEQLKSEF